MDTAVEGKGLLSSASENRELQQRFHFHLIYLFVLSLSSPTPSLANNGASNQIWHQISCTWTIYTIQKADNYVPSECWQNLTWQSSVSWNSGLEKGLVSGSMSCEIANWDHYVSSERVNANFRGIQCGSFSPSELLSTAICDDISQMSGQQSLRNELKSTRDKMYFKQNVQGGSFQQKLLLVHALKIINKNICQHKNMKSSFISIGNLIQSTKWCVFLKTVTIPFT